MSDTHSLPTTVSPYVAPQEPAADAITELDPRGYHLLETLGKGGMGEVYRCADPALGRDLAIKVIKDKYRGEAEIEQRFVREAHITGSLQHPGIVPIHNLGRLADGRLHYTMRLVQGRTFADILQDEAGRSERWPELLTIFVKICQAVAYAHSKRVIHRDLKPSNVMVGKFGEVQVMDWGLVKLLPESERGCVSAPSAPLGERGCVSAPSGVLGALTQPRSPQDASFELTRMGSGIGTPAYMPPEQARGEWDRVDERSDVFALGAILCEILTGKPPYAGGDSEDVYSRAKRGAVSEAMTRLDQCGADATLTMLCRDCLAPECEARPREAGAVAQRVVEYQTEVQARLQRAEVERARAVVKAHEERIRRWLIFSSMLLLSAVALLAVWQAMRATKAEKKAVTERDDKEVALLQAQDATQAERRARELGQKRQQQIEKANAVLASIFHDLDPRAEEKNGPSLRRQLSQHLQRAAKQLDEAAIGDAAALARLQATLGLSLLNFGQIDRAIELLSAARTTLEAKLGSDHLDTLTCGDSLATAYLDAGRTTDAIRLHKQILRQRESKLGPDHPDTLTSRSNLAADYQDAGRIAESIRLLKQNLQQENKLGPDQANMLTSRNNLAAAYRALDRIEDAIRLWEQNLKLLEAKLGPGHPDTLGGRSNLATAYQIAGRSRESIRLLEQNLTQMEEKLGADHKDTLISRNNLANAYLGSGRTADAIRLHQQNLRQREAKLGPDHPDTLFSMAGLGVSHRSAGRPKDAIPLLEAALQRGRRRPGGLPPSLAPLVDDLAYTYDLVGQFAKAEPLYRDFLTQAQKQFGADDLRTAAAMAQLGGNLLKQKKFADAETALRQCLKIRDKKQPDEWTTFNIHSALGEALAGQKKYKEAEPLLLQGYEGMKKRQDKIPSSVRKLRLDEARQRLVQLYDAWGKKNEADKWRKELSAVKTSAKK